MVNSDSFLFTSGVILTILISATVISYTTKYIFVSDKVKKSTNQIYDPDYGLNFSNVCVISKNSYKMSYERSCCFNKTLAQWYNPWLRHNLWTGFWNEIQARNRIKMLKAIAVNKTDIPLLSNDTALPPDLPKKSIPEEVEKPKEKPIEFVYSILVGLLIISGIFACWEVCKDKLKRNEAAEAAKAQERQCTLAEFTINRHLRRESQQQTYSHLPRQGSLELTAKVTQNLIHQSSLDRAFPKTISEAVASSHENRRNSVPLYLNSDVPAAPVPHNPKLTSTKRQSLDLPGEEVCLDIRKKPRHFIRRH